MAGASPGRASWPSGGGRSRIAGTSRGRSESDLLGAGETVARVPTHLMVGARRSSRTPGQVRSNRCARGRSRRLGESRSFPVAQLAGTGAIELKSCSSITARRWW